MKAKLRKASIHEPMPTGDGKIIIDEVLKDLEERALIGEKKYGTKLKTKNGRDALNDLYQELLDSVMYLKQVILESEGE